MMRLCAVLVLLIAGCPVMVQAEPVYPWSVGFHRLSFLDPLDDQPMRAIAFYPSTDPEGVSKMGSYEVLAALTAFITNRRR